MPHDPSAIILEVILSVYPINKGFNQNALLKKYCNLVYRGQSRGQLSLLKHHFFNQFGVRNGYIKTSIDCMTIIVIKR